LFFLLPYMNIELRRWDNTSMEDVELTPEFLKYGISPHLKYLAYELRKYHMNARHVQDFQAVQDASSEKVVCVLHWETSERETKICESIPMDMSHQTLFTREEYEAYQAWLDTLYPLEFVIWHRSQYFAQDEQGKTIDILQDLVSTPILNELFIHCITDSKRRWTAQDGEWVPSLEILQMLEKRAKGEAINQSYYTDIYNLCLQGIVGFIIEDFWDTQLQTIREWNEERKAEIQSRISDMSAFRKKLLSYVKGKFREHEIAGKIKFLIDFEDVDFRKLWEISQVVQQETREEQKEFFNLLEEVHTWIRDMYIAYIWEIWVATDEEIYEAFWEIREVEIPRIQMFFKEAGRKHIYEQLEKRRVA